MVLFVEDNKEKHPLSFSELNEESKEIILKNIEKNIEIRLPYYLEINREFNPDDYILFLLFHNNLPENAIFQLYEKDINDRIGWIFPINALISSNHDYKDNIHFLKMAYVSCINLAKGEICNNNQSNLIKLPNQNAAGLFDFFHQQTVIVILHKNTIQKILNFNFYNYLPCLYTFGYTLTFNPEKKVHQSKLSEFYEEGESIRKRITLIPISIQIRDETFINKLFTEWLDSEHHKVMRFYLLYQVVELLIRRVFKHKFQKTISVINPDKDDLFEVNKKIQELTSEKKRINCLISDYSGVNSNELKDLCVQFLNNTDYEESGLGDLIYSIRSFLVHNYRELTENQKNLIDDINYWFENLIIKILLNYKEQ